MSRIEVGPRTVITDREKRYLLSALSLIRKVPGRVSRRTSRARSPEMFPQYQHDSRSTLNAALTVKRSTIFCSCFSFFVRLSFFLDSRSLNWSTWVLICSSTQLARVPQEFARRIFGSRTVRVPQYADRTEHEEVSDGLLGFSFLGISKFGGSTAWTQPTTSIPPCFVRIFLRKKIYVFGSVIISQGDINIFNSAKIS